MKKTIALLAITISAANASACAWYTKAGTVKCEMKDMRTQIESICKDLSSAKKGTVQVSRKSIVDALSQFNKHVTAAQVMETTNSQKAKTAQEKTEINDGFHGMVSAEAMSAQGVIDTLNMNTAESLNSVEIEQVGTTIDEMLSMAKTGHEYFAQGVQVTILGKDTAKETPKCIQ